MLLRRGVSAGLDDGVPRGGAGHRGRAQSRSAHRGPGGAHHVLARQTVVVPSRVHGEEVEGPPAGVILGRGMSRTGDCRQRRTRSARTWARRRRAPTRESSAPIYVLGRGDCFGPLQGLRRVSPGGSGVGVSPRCRFLCTLFSGIVDVVVDFRPFLVRPQRRDKSRQRVATQGINKKPERSK